jgi:lysophospholipase L1-like esterase
MRRSLQVCLMIALAVATMAAVQPAKPASKSTQKTSSKKTARKKQTAKKIAPTAIAKPATAKSTPAKSTTAKTAAKKTTAKKTTARKVASKRVVVSAKVRATAHDVVLKDVANAADIPVENAAALIPFFEQLYRHQEGEIPGPLRILHYGDSHTAADEWTGTMRMLFQEKFGNGGSGYSLAGKPWNSYRREDVRSGSTRGWHTDGLVTRTGDGIYGLGGISMTAVKPRESVYLETDAADFELFYYQQPGGGEMQLYDNGTPVELIPTDGEPGPAYYHLEDVPGSHRLEVETLDAEPVRLFGWVAENPTGVTYEELGINGAQASIMLGWDEETLRSNIERRNPALIVLAYGTNEAGHTDWTLESYRDMFSQIIARLRADAPTATILVIGPPDRSQYSRSKGWQTLSGVDMIAEAQREAALSSGCAFWDLRQKMGGKGSMLQWVKAGIAQADHVHFTGAGYQILGDAVFRDLMSQYDIFLKARKAIVAQAPDLAAPAWGPPALDPEFEPPVVSIGFHNSQP